MGAVFFWFEPTVSVVDHVEGLSFSCAEIQRRNRRIRELDESHALVAVQRHGAARMIYLAPTQFVRAVGGDDRVRLELPHRSARWHLPLRLGGVAHVNAAALQGIEAFIPAVQRSLPSRLSSLVLGHKNTLESLITSDQ